MSSNDLRTLLDRIRGVRHACDLDLLLFFFRHPCALLTSEQIVAFLGYDRERVGKSLDGLIDAGLLTRSQNPSHAARLYMLQLHARPDGLLSSLFETRCHAPGPPGCDAAPAVRAHSGSRRRPTAQPADS